MLRDEWLLRDRVVSFTLDCVLNLSATFHPRQGVYANVAAVAFFKATSDSLFRLWHLWLDDEQLHIDLWSRFSD